MLDIASTELLLVAVVALLVIGPKDLPKAMRFVGKWVGKARGVARHFRSGMDAMVREAELAELEKQWAAENERIMRENPASAPALPAPAPYDPSMPPMPEIVEQPAPVMVEQPAMLDGYDAPEAIAPGTQEPAAPAPRPRARRKPAAKPAS